MWRLSRDYNIKAFVSSVANVYFFKNQLNIWAMVLMQRDYTLIQGRLKLHR